MYLSPHEPNKAWQQNEHVIINWEAQRGKYRILSGYLGAKLVDTHLKSLDLRVEHFYMVSRRPVGEQEPVF